MRKGYRCKHWTTDDVLYLIENAGVRPKREICRHLRRSPKSVERKTAQLRSLGFSIDLRCYKRKLKVCPSCGCMRVLDHKSGICEPCRRKQQLATIQRRIAALYPLLDKADRDTYFDTEAKTASSPLPMPKPPIVKGLSRYQAARLIEKYDIAMEAWTTANLCRQIKAAQKRKERIYRKIVKE